MSAFTVSSATAVRAPVRVAARRNAGAKIARGSVLARYTVTLETPEGAQAIECADDTYILDAAEVRRAPRARLDLRREETSRGARHIFVSIHRAVQSAREEDRRVGGHERVRIPRGVDRDRERYPSIIWVRSGLRAHARARARID